MSAEVRAAKEVLRREVRARLRRLSGEARACESGRIRERLETSLAFQRARCVLGYVALGSEPDVWEVLERAMARGVEVAVPRWDEGSRSYAAVRAPRAGEWVIGPHGAREPGAEATVLAFERLDLVLVPGLAFDRSGRRLGRGHGYFDRMLARATQALRWGIGWDLQVVDAVPAEAHDMSMDALVTPGGWDSVTSRSGV